MTDTLRKVAEDALLLAANVREGNDLGEQPLEDGFEAALIAREGRVVELIVELVERLAKIAGFGPDDIWTPDVLRDTVEIEAIS